MASKRRSKRAPVAAVVAGVVFLIVVDDFGSQHVRRKYQLSLASQSRLNVQLCVTATLHSVQLCQSRILEVDDTLHVPGRSQRPLEPPGSRCVGGPIPMCQ